MGKNKTNEAVKTGKEKSQARKEEAKKDKKDKGDGMSKKERRALKQAAADKEKADREASRAQMMRADEDSEAEEEEVAPQPVKKSKKKKAKAVENKSDDDDDDEEDNDEQTDPVPVKKSGSKKAKRRAAAVEAILNPEPEHVEMLEAQEMKEHNKIAVRNMKEIPGTVSEIQVQDGIVDSGTKDIIVNCFTISLGSKRLFDQAELRIAHGRRYGLLGPNGQGKTTLLRHIAARNLPYPSHIRTLYVDQEIEGSDTTAFTSVIMADEVQMALQEEQKVLNKWMEEATDDVDDELWETNNKRLQEIERLGADDSEARARMILNGLGFDTAMQNTATKNFSGGWRMRISLARALFVNPDLLLLDEPTNHLDLQAVLWLDDYLSETFKGTLLVVSHDQDFLNEVCTDIIHLDSKRLEYYRGDYDAFEATRDQRVAKQAKEYELQQKKIKSLVKGGMSQKEAEHSVAKKAGSGGPAKGGKKAGKGGSGARLGNKGKHIEDEKGAKLVQKVKDYVVNFQFNDVDSRRPRISVEDVGFRYSPDHPVLFEDMNFGINCDTRVVLLGKNGSGKSTCLNLLAGLLEPTQGEVKYEGRPKIGVYSQHFEEKLPMDQTPVSYLQAEYNEKEFQCRQLLGRFGLEGHAHLIPIAKLSGGQKARVVFASLYLMRPHILFLDEPTNHLDIESTNSLIEAIKNFEGGVVAVTHDARLIVAAELQVWLCDHDERNIVQYTDGFEPYREEVLSEMRAEQEEAQRQHEERLRLKAEKRKEREKAIAARSRPPVQAEAEAEVAGLD